jgi:hypothetical protein
MSFLSDPVYTQLVAHFAAGNKLVDNPNAAAFDDLCQTLLHKDADALIAPVIVDPAIANLQSQIDALAGTPPPAPPTALAAALTQVETALYNLYKMSDGFIIDYAAMTATIAKMVTLLSPTDATVTEARIKSECMEVLLADFTSSYIAPWKTQGLAALAQTLDADKAAQLTTLATAMANLYTTQSANWQAWLARLAAAQSACDAMSAANTGSAGNLAAALQGILSKLSGLAMSFGHIEDPPGQEYKKAKAAKKSASSSSASTGSDGSYQEAGQPTGSTSGTPGTTTA